jgi:hypothetical protein
LADLRATQERTSQERAQLTARLSALTPEEYQQVRQAAMGIMPDIARRSVEDDARIEDNIQLRAFAAQILEEDKAGGQELFA